MPMEFIRDVESWDRIAPEWNELLARSAAGYPFLRREYLRAWWDHLGGGEWPAAELRVALWRESGALRGAAPLFRSARDGEPRWFLVGSTEISDYLDLLAAPEHLAAFCSQLLEALAEFPETEFAALDLFNLHASSPTIPALEAETARRGWRLERRPLQVCPVVTLPASWEEYLAGLDKKTRHEIRRKLRRAEAGEEETGLVSRGAEATEDFLRLMACDGEKAAFLTSAMREQFRAIANAAEQAGMLDLAFLETGGRKIAAYMLFQFRDRIWVYNSGMDPQFASNSPGWVLLALLIRRAIEKGCRAFDFMRGDEPYKFQWGGVSEPIVRLTIHKA
jgi:CelD/BcsL family acetyltransferase involved in cellulose biosynthesis